MEPPHGMTLLMDAHRAALPPPPPCMPPVCLWGGFALSSQHEDIIQMLSGLVDVKERPNWVSNPGRFSSPPVKRHLARTWLPVPFLRPPWLPLCRPNLCLCLSLSSRHDARSTFSQVCDLSPPVASGFHLSPLTLR